MRWAGMPKNAFGGACVTNIGSLGLDTAYVPVVPYTRVPIWVAPGEIADEPVVEDGAVVPGRVMRINATFDHRFIDGYHAMVLSRTLRRVLENPFEELDPLD
jgi:pyruvate/2-oxoglutarate dehydrogenase complex dihydrolipoamide acyltransferase (E2) component